MHNIALALCMIAITSGCSSRHSDSARDAERHRPDVAVAPAIDPLPGTHSMAAELAAIYEDQLRNPFQYYHLNRVRAESLRVAITRTRGAAQLPARFYYIQELVFAGELDTAIRELEQLMRDAGPDASVLSPQSKPLFELLAISYLRKAGLPDCLPSVSCTMPVGRDAEQPGSENVHRAIELYELILADFPDDLTSRWLLNLAHVTIGSYPDGVPDGLRIEFANARRDRIIPPFENLAPSLGVDVVGRAGGAVLEDFNRDGFIDILASASGLSEQIRFFLADGEGRFVDHTAAAGLTGIVGGLNILHADYDNDGFDDVYVLRGAWLGSGGAHPNSLLKNNGDGTFEDVTTRAGLLTRQPTQTAAWADFNNDGWIDLFVGNESGGGGGMGAAGVNREGARHPASLFMNNGDGTFTDVAAQVGIELSGFVKAVAWGDVNNDGLSDLYVSRLGEPNVLYVNQGETTSGNWHFVDRAAEAGVRDAQFSFPVFFFDYNNDGWQDLFVASYDPRLMADAMEIVAGEHLGRSSAGETNWLFRNNGDGTFTDVAPEVGLALSLWTMGLNFGDLNNDGYPDVYFGTGSPDLRALMPNRMFVNEAGTRFVEVTYEGGFGHVQKGHGIAFADLDHDGDQDIYEVMGGAYEGDGFENVLYENPGVPDHAWVVLQLEGRASNRSAIGARIRVSVTESDGSTRFIHTTVSTGGSFGASSLQQEIGLGRASRIDEVRITWPDRAHTTDTHTNIRPNGYYRIVEGGEAVHIEKPSVVLGSMN